MSFTWWWAWVAFVFFFIVSPSAYGWGYRGWGPPVPQYLQRRRVASTVVVAPATTPHHLAWGITGDFIWLVAIFAVVSMLSGLYFRGWPW